MSRKKKDEETKAILEDVAKRNNWQRLGWSDVDLEVKLTPIERENFSKVQTDGLIEIEKLQTDFKKVAADFKNKIQGIAIDVNQAAHSLKKGSQVVTKNLPTFLDAKRGLKLFYEHESGEVVKEVEASDKDRQANIDGVA